MLNVKKARELGRELVRCEKVINDSKSSKEDINRAKSKISLIAQAYRHNSEMMFAIIGEADKIAEKELQK